MKSFLVGLGLALAWGFFLHPLVGMIRGMSSVNG